MFRDTEVTTGDKTPVVRTEDLAILMKYLVQEVNSINKGLDFIYNNKVDHIKKELDFLEERLVAVVDYCEKAGGVNNVS